MGKRKKMLVWSALAVLLVAVGLFIFFDSIIAKEWDDKRQAVLRAYQDTMMVKADRVEPFVGDKPYVVVFGEDKLGKKMIVWVGPEQEIEARYQEEGLTEEAVRLAAANTAPGTRIERATPGILDGELVWEVYGQRQRDDGGSTYFYEYYRFSDGAHLDTYRLGTVGS